MSKRSLKASFLFPLQLIILALISGCGNIKPPINNKASVTMPNLFFEQAIMAEKSSKAQSNSVETDKIVDCQPLTKNTVVSQSKKYIGQDIFADTSKPEVNPPTSQRQNEQNDQNTGGTGKGTAQFGLFINAVTLLGGIVLAATIGFGWGSSIGIIWILFLLLSIPLLLIGLFTSLSGYHKMKRKNVPPSFLKISLYSLLAFLGSILIWIIQFISN
jgi:hypothetical protein